MKDYTRRQNWAEFVEPEKLGVELDSTWFDCRTVRVDLLWVFELFPVWVIFVISGRTRQFEVRLLESDLRGIRGGRRIQISRQSRFAVELCGRSG